MSERVVVDRHLYLTEDGSRVVEEGDPAGRTLWVSPGRSVLLADAERFGAVELMQHPRPPAVKQAGPLTNKQAPPPANKAR